MGVESELATARSRSSVMGYGLWGLISLSVRRYSVIGFSIVYWLLISERARGCLLYSGCWSGLFAVASGIGVVWLFGCVSGMVMLG
jgi:hypothetical protein